MALLQELRAATPKVTSQELYEEWLRIAPPRSPTFPEGVNLVALETYRSAKGRIRLFMEYLKREHKGLHVLHVTPPVCDAYFAYHEARVRAGELESYRAIQTAGTDLKAYYEWLRARKGLLPQGNPWTDPLRGFIDRHKDDETPEHRALRLWELTNVLESAGARDFVGILASTKLMARCGEAIHIQDTDVFLKERFIALKQHPKRKGPKIQGLPKKLRDKARQGYFLFPIDEELTRVLEWWYDEGKWEWSDNHFLIPSSTRGNKPFSHQGWLDAIKRVVKLSDVVVEDWNDPLEKVGTHTCRRTGSSLLEEGSEGRFPLKFDALRGDSLLTRGGSKGAYIKHTEDDLRSFYESSMPSFGADKILRDLRQKGSIDARIQEMVEKARGERDYAT